MCQSAELSLRVSWSHETGSLAGSFLQHILLVASEAREAKPTAEQTSGPDCTSIPVAMSEVKVWEIHSTHREGPGTTLL